LSKNMKKRSQNRSIFSAQMAPECGAARLFQLLHQKWGKFRRSRQPQSPSHNPFRQRPPLQVRPVRPPRLISTQSQ